MTEHKDEIAVIAEIPPGAVDEMVSRLRAEGFNAVALSNPMTGDLWYPVAGSPYPYDERYVCPVVYITVEHDEREAAEALLAGWRQAEAQQAKAISSAALKDSLGALFVAAVTGTVLYVRGSRIETIISSSVVVWIAAFIIALACREVYDNWRQRL